MIAREIRVTGRVQGVFFRKHTKETADRLNIKGWVMNETDGSVSIVAEGAEEDMEAFVNWCRRGPDRANVDHIEIHEARVNDYKSFEIRR